MNSFAYVLSELRRRSGLTQRALAERINKTPAYVCALEAETGEKTPSLETLRDLVGVLAADDRKPHGLDVGVVLPLIGAVFGWTFDLVPPEVSAEAEYLEAFKQAHVVWSASDVLIEAQSLTMAEQLAENIRANQTRFVFLVPFSVSSWQCTRLLENLERSGLTIRDIEKHVSIFYASQSAFPCHYQICDPLSSNAQGFYFLGTGNPSGPVTVHRMPVEVRTKVVEVLRNLCSMFHSRLYSTQRNELVSDVVGDFIHGHIQLQFPVDRAEAIRQRHGADAERDFGHLTGSPYVAGRASLARPAIRRGNRTVLLGGGN